MKAKLFLNKVKKILKDYRRPSSYYYNNKTNIEYWKGAKQGWKDCIDYIVDIGDLDEEFTELFNKISSLPSSKRSEVKK